MSGSDLAPFVAAALKDKTVADLKDENEQLRTQLRRCREIEVTGPDGQPVYARTYLDKGGYHGNPNLWSVKLTESEQLLPCPLANLTGLEIRIGGIIRAALNDRHNFNCYLRDYVDDADGHWVNISFSGGDIWLCIAIKGWPQEFWDASTEHLENGDEFAFLQYLARNDNNSQGTVAIKDVTVSVKSAKGALESFSAFNDPEALEENKQKDAVNSYLQLIAERLRENGNNEGPATFLRKCQKLMIILCKAGVYGPGDRFEEVIGDIIETQERLDYPSDFEDE